MTPECVLACVTADRSCGNPRCAVCRRVDPDDGWVYFVRGADGLIKIGSTISLRQRVRHLKGEFLYAIRGSARVERRLHEVFGHLRVEGEWFRAEHDLLAFINLARVASGDWIKWAA